MNEFPNQGLYHPMELEVPDKCQHCPEIGGVSRVFVGAELKRRVVLGIAKALLDPELASSAFDLFNEMNPPNAIPKDEEELASREARKAAAEEVNDIENFLVRIQNEVKEATDGCIGPKTLQGDTGEHTYQVTICASLALNYLGHPQAHECTVLVDKKNNYN